MKFPLIVDFLKEEGVIRIPLSATFLLSTFKDKHNKECIKQRTLPTAYPIAFLSFVVY